MLQNMSIRARLLLGFGIVILFLIIVGVVAVLNVRSAQTVTVDLYTHPFTVTNSLKNAHTHIIKMHRGMKDVVLSANPEELNTTIAAVDDSGKEVYSNLKIVRERYLGPKEDVDEVVRELEAWQPIQREVINLMKTNQKDRALSVHKGEASNNVSRIERKMDAVIEFAMNKAESFYEDSMEIEEQTIRLLIVLFIAAVLIAVTVAMLITRSITTPLNKAVEVAEKLALGDMSAEIDAVSKDETGVLLRSMDRMVGSLKEMASAADKISKGEMIVNVRPRSEKDILGKSMQDMVGYLKGIAAIAERIAGRDLNVRFKPLSEKDLLGNAFTGMIDNLRGMTKDLQESVNVLATSASEILSSTTEVASSVTETATSVSETTTTVEEVKQTAQVSSQKAQHVSDAAQKAVQISHSGGKAVDDTVEKMDRIRQQMESVAESIVRLSEQSQAIGEIIATVNDLAEQSNLLAVNASIEASKAGEHGKGFVVVAQEMRSLAEQSKQATAQVRLILNEIQKATSAAVLATEQGSKTVEEGMKQSELAGDAIKALAASITEAAQAATQITASSQQQLVGMEQVISAMNSIRLATEQNVAGTKQTEGAAHNLHELGQKLKKLVEQYKT